MVSKQFENASQSPNTKRVNNERENCWTSGIHWICIFFERFCNIQQVHTGRYGGTANCKKCQRISCIQWACLDWFPTTRNLFELLEIFLFFSSFFRKMTYNHFHSNSFEFFIQFHPSSFIICFKDKFMWCKKVVLSNKSIR